MARASWSLRCGRLMVLGSALVIGAVLLSTFSPSTGSPCTFSSPAQQPESRRLPGGTSLRGAAQPCVDPAEASWATAAQAFARSICSAGLAAALLLGTVGLVLPQPAEAAQSKATPMASWATSATVKIQALAPAKNAQAGLDAAVKTAEAAVKKSSADLAKATSELRKVEGDKKMTSAQKEKLLQDARKNFTEAKKVNTKNELDVTNSTKKAATAKTELAKLEKQVQEVKQEGKNRLERVRDVEQLVEKQVEEAKRMVTDANQKMNEVKPRFEKVEKEADKKVQAAKNKLSTAQSQLKASKDSKDSKVLVKKAESELALIKEQSTGPVNIAKREMTAARAGIKKAKDALDSAQAKLAREKADEAAVKAVIDAKAEAGGGGGGKFLGLF
eukprot:TRINITY_DN6935_c0_g1_i1.p1 TRINITY_DN6935_c0_g1~~TRINITY_DN6935_c0_g1_i1.p1  ORF type:complete len:388 (-),score=148.53 TRINITY_DN6935_c0_g1_i1:515-1678(-)